MKDVLKKVLTEKKARSQKTLGSLAIASTVIASPWGS